MSDETISYTQARHPAPNRARVGLTLLFYGLFLGPIIWAGTLMATFALSIHACYPGADPLSQPSPGFGFVWPLNLGLYLGSLVLCASAFVVSFRNWRTAGSSVVGHGAELVTVEEGRTRYLALIGMAYSVLFFISVMLGAVIMAIVPLCANYR